MVIHGSSQNCIQSNIRRQFILRHIKVSVSKRLELSILSVTSRYGSVLIFSSFQGTFREEEDEKIAIRDMSFVSGLSFHRVMGNQNQGYRVNLNCHEVFSHGSCGEKQSATWRMSSICPTAVSSADTSTKRPVDEGTVSSNSNNVLMIRAKLKSLEEHTFITNKSVLETRSSGIVVYNETISVMKD